MIGNWLRSMYLLYVTVVFDLMKMWKIYEKGLCANYAVEQKLSFITFNIIVFVSNLSFCRYRLNFGKRTNVFLLLAQRKFQIICDK